MGKVIDLTGRRFGRLVVVRLDGRIYGGQAAWECKCDCGAVKRVAAQPLKEGRALSCGCLCREPGRGRKHGHGHGTPEYIVWCGMVQRCTNPRAWSFAKYGARGITVCARWRRFSEFIADMGLRPSPKHSIDRIDNAKGYEPGNCHWATDTEQRANQRRTRWVMFNGEKITLSSALQKVGARGEKAYRYVRYRIAKRGLPFEKAIVGVPS